MNSQPKYAKILMLIIVTDILRLWGASSAMADPLLQVAPLEPERVHPSLTVAIPAFPSQPETQRFALFNYQLGSDQKWAPVRRVLFLRVPEEFTGKDTGEPVRNWGLNLLIFYPDMTGPFNPKNIAKLETCAWECPGEMLISIYNNIGIPYSAPERRLTALENLMHENFSVMPKFSEISPGEFSKIIKEEHGDDPKNISDDLHFIKNNQSGRIMFFADCPYNTPIHLCELYTYLPMQPEIEVDYSIHLEEIGKWQEIQERVLNFTNSMIVGDFKY